MQHRADWFKVFLAWVGTGIANYFDHFTLGMLIGIATFVLTVLQIVRVWLQIRYERQRMQSWHKS